MKKILLSTLLFCCTISGLNAQEIDVANGVFTDFNQFKSKKSCPIQSIKLKKKNDFLLSVKSIEADCYGYKKPNKLIAIHYENEIYYNMKYNVEFLTRNKFSKLLVIGKYCAFIVNESFPINIQGQAGFNTGGLLGALILGPNGKNKIYYLDVDKGHKTKVLSRNRLIKILSVDQDLLDSFTKEKDISAELFLSYLRKVNLNFVKND